MTGKHKIDFYFDFSSPYGYLGAQKIDGLAENYHCDVTWRPIMLGAILKHTGGRPQADIPLKNEYMLHDVPRMAEMMDVPFVWPENFPIATLAAARAFYWIEDTEPGLAKPFARACYLRYFGHGVDISPPQEVINIARELGVDGEALAAAIQADEVKQRVKDETAKAMDLGVFGSPYFLIDGEPFFGSDRFWLIERHLGKKGGKA